MAAEANLYVTLKSEMGRQFCICSLDLLPLGRQVMTHCLKDKGKMPFLYDSFKARRIKCFSFDQKKFRNSDGRPSVPGVLLCFVFLMLQHVLSQ